jgi:hypothetical protein
MPAPAHVPAAMPSPRPSPPNAIPAKVDEPDTVMLAILRALKVAEGPLSTAGLAVAVGICRGSLFHRDRLNRLQSLGLIVFERGAGYRIADRSLPLPGPIGGDDSHVHGAGPYSVNTASFAGVDVAFGRAAILHRLATSLWDKKRNRPTRPRSVRDLIAEVWGEHSKLTDSTFRRMCVDMRRLFEASGCPLTILRTGGQVSLEPIVRVSDSTTRPERRITT